MTEPPHYSGPGEESAGAFPKATAGARERRSERASSPHSHRFRTATAVLFGFAVGAVLIAVAVAISSGSTVAGSNASPWSSWAPTESGTLGAREIADELIERKELLGDEVGDLLERVALRRPELDLMDTSTWPET